ncbi:MAG: bifunctional phosphoribosylaminoimidazolecarboxamide formyltransferase/IMP cyclohydrolase [Oligoflexia bacterium]|nr:bifunctional phosphoribosylaminoimidazolecarboxamide formyltransferase/IMP cyclohydrolase [Oligoflexia bacterium]
MKIKNALLSVSDKSGLRELAQCLQSMNVNIISTGGTGRMLEEYNIPNTKIEDFSGKKEILGGRVKTLGYELYAGLLFQREENSDTEEIKSLGIEPIDLVVCNLYPFAKSLSKRSDYASLIENIDIGGPCMIRAAAKNHKYVTVLSSPAQYPEFIEEFTKNKSTSLSLRRSLAVDAFGGVARYDQMIATGLAFESEKENIKPQGTSYSLLRYGENPHQKGIAFYNQSTSLGSAQVVQGKAMSYNNYLDADAAYNTLLELNSTLTGLYSTVIIKHGNPCGVSSSTNELESFLNAWNGDPVSAFGSVIAVNYKLDSKVAHELASRFVEVILAPEITKDARKILAQKKNLRLIDTSKIDRTFDFYHVKSVTGGTLVQEKDRKCVAEFKKVTDFQDNLDHNLALFSNICVKGLKSNAICLTKKLQNGFMLVGAGMGNPNRLISTIQAFEKAKANGFEDFSDVYLTSDAFFPFPDNVELASEFKLNTIIQPGGSIKDNLVIKAANKNNINMYFTGQRHFNH